MNMTITRDFFELAVKRENSDLDPNLLHAISIVESNKNPNIVRYEPKWKYWFNVSQYARQLGITHETEKILQAMSWGLMQIMGTVAREHGFDDHMTVLTEPFVNLKYSIKVIESLFTKWLDLDSVISSYNQGSPRLNESGSYTNQDYVDRVLYQYKILKTS